MVRMLDAVDHITGEVVEQGVYIELRKPKRRHPYGGKWVYLSLSEQALRLLASVKNMTDMRVFLQMLKHMEFKNEVRIYQNAMAREMEMQPSHVSTSIKRLVAAGLLHPKTGERGIFYIDEDVMWRGNLADKPKQLHRQSQKAQMEAMDA